MKKLLVLLSLALAFVVSGAEETKFYRGGEFNVSVYGSVTTPDFDQERASIGASAGFFLTEHLGLEVEGFAGDTSGVFVEQIAAQGVYRIPIGKSAPYLFAGAFNVLETKEWGISVGAGIEHRFTPNFGLFADARLEKLLDSGDPAARARTGLRFAF